jgi:hypothetical protein
MRTLTAAPDDALDPATLEPRYGSYRGGLSRIEAGRAAKGRFAGFTRVARGKRWLFLAIARDPIIATLAILRFGYASNAFAFVYHAGERRMLAEASSLGPASAAYVGDSTGAGGEETRARFRFGRFRASVVRDAGVGGAGGGGPGVGSPGFGGAGVGGMAYTVDLAAAGLDLHARLDAAGAPPSIAAVAPVRDGFVATEKRALLSATGEMTIGGRRFTLDDGLAGYDYTQGLLPRRTAWRWAFALGLAKNGEPFAVNLVEGHVGEPECAAWTGQDVHPLSEGRFALDPSHPLEPWRVTTADGGVDLLFSPGAVHAETKSLGIVRSRFLQSVGTYEGTVRLGDRPDRPLEVEAMLGVAEDQDVLW